MSALQAAIGHNNPPSPIEILRGELVESNGELIARKDALIEAVGRVPQTIEDDATAGKIGDFVKQLTGAHKSAEAARVAAKEPHLEASRAVDGFFKPITDGLAEAKKTVERKYTAYLQKKADDARRERLEQERIAREAAEAELRAAEAARATEAVEQHLDAAAQHETQAIQHAESADAKAADLSRVRGDYGSVGSLRTTWESEVEDIHAIPLETIRPYLPVAAVEQAVRGFVKAGGRQLPGARIFEKHAAVVR